MSAAPNLASAAAMLATRGIPVFPCAAGGKQPLTHHGFHDASIDLASVKGWWQRWPEANIAVPTGAVSGVDVVDVDVHSEGSGFSAFEQARATGLTEGWAWLIRTPSGGIHAYYLHGPRQQHQEHLPEQRSWQIPSRHIDFRGDGGYIVAPPSRVSLGDRTARPYELIAVAQHRPRPIDATALRTFLEPPRPTRPPTGMPALGSRPDKLAAWVAARPEGARNHGLFWAACRMAEDGHDLNTTTEVLAAAAVRAGLPEREAMTTLRSAYRIATKLGPTPTRETPRPPPPASTRPAEVPAEAVGL